MMMRHTIDMLVRVMVAVAILLIIFVVVWRKWQTVVPLGVQPEVRVGANSILAPDAGVVDEEMNGSTVVMRVGDIKKIVLRGNATTGYAWRVVRIEGESVVPDGDWRYRISFPFLIGSGGHFQRRFRAVAPGQTDVYMTYDPVSEPQVGYSYFIRFIVK